MIHGRGLGFAQQHVPLYLVSANSHSKFLVGRHLIGHFLGRSAARWIKYDRLSLFKGFYARSKNTFSSFFTIQEGCMNTVFLDGGNTF